MITLAAPISIPLNTIEIPVNPKYTILDDPSGKVIVARFAKIANPLILWSGDAYDQIGNWTQDQADARITELLGSDPASVFKSLIPFGVGR
jgi:hypothetical protein